MSTPYTRTTDFLTAGAANRSAAMNRELDLIVTAFASSLVDPTYSGNARAVTRASTDNSTLLATTAFVHSLIAVLAPLLPLQTGNSGKWLYTNGTAASWAIFPVATFDIFDAATATLNPVSSLETMENSIVATGLATCSQVLYGSALFVAAPLNAAANVATSADGLTWILRTMPSSAAWTIGTDGSGKWVATASNSTAVSYSADDGVTWTATTALAAVAKQNYSNVVFVGTRCFVLAEVGGTAYTSTDYGTTWATQTLPGSQGGMAPYSVGGVFWFWAATTQAYTSTTGATGSWTSRTLPFTPSDSIWQDFDGSLIGRASGGTQLYRTTDGITWNTLITVPNAGGMARLINSVYGQFSSTLGNAMTYHNGTWMRRTSAGTDAVASSRRVDNKSTEIYLIPDTAGSVIRVAPAEASARTAVFSTL